MGHARTMNPPKIRSALPRANPWRVNLRLDPRLNRSAITPLRSHQAARRHLIGILTPLRS
ncbi:MAG: hypothetical protein NTZ08_00055 [Verrucomicrobia bacterium]|nr:hypothetical protein [Verrucomicrobiota bacterium]